MIMIGGGWSLGLNAFRLTELRRAFKASIHISDRMFSFNASLRRVVGIVVAPIRCEAVYGGAICRKVGFVASQG